MPLLHLHLRKGKPPEFHRAVANQVFDALTAEGKAPADSRVCWVHEFTADQMMSHPAYGGVERSDEPILIEITLNAGRTVEVKKAIYRKIVENLETALQVRPDDVIINLRETPKENWSWGRGLATYL